MKLSQLKASSLDNYITDSWFYFPNTVVGRILPHRRNRAQETPERANASTADRLKNFYAIAPINPVKASSIGIEVDQYGMIPLTDELINAELYSPPPMCVPLRLTSDISILSVAFISRTGDRQWHRGFYPTGYSVSSYVPIGGITRTKNYKWDERANGLMGIEDVFRNPNSLQYILNPPTNFCSVPEAVDTLSARLRESLAVAKIIAPEFSLIKRVQDIYLYYRTTPVGKYYKGLGLFPKFRAMKPLLEENNITNVKFFN